MNTFCSLQNNQLVVMCKHPSKNMNKIKKRMEAMNTRKKNSFKKTIDYVKQVAQDDIEYYSEIIKEDMQEMKNEFDNKNNVESTKVEIFNLMTENDDDDDDDDDDSIFVN